MSLKARFAGRKLPTTTYRLRVEDDGPARADLDAARKSGDEAGVNAAQTSVQECYEELAITALPPEDLEQLIEAHPPNQKHQQKQILFNPVTFIPALLAACIDSDIDEGSWAEYTTRGPMTRGEVNDLFGVVWGLNHRAPDPWLGKDWT